MLPLVVRKNSETELTSFGMCMERNLRKRNLLGEMAITSVRELLYACIFKFLIKKKNKVT